MSNLRNRTFICLHMLSSFSYHLRINIFELKYNFVFDGCLTGIEVRFYIFLRISIQFI
jgi:hypothetical protein